MYVSFPSPHPITRLFSRPSLYRKTHNFTFFFPRLCATSLPRPTSCHAFLTPAKHHTRRSLPSSATRERRPSLRIAPFSSTSCLPTTPCLSLCHTSFLFMVVPNNQKYIFFLKEIINWTWRPICLSAGLTNWIWT